MCGWSKAASICRSLRKRRRTKSVSMPRLTSLMAARLLNSLSARDASYTAPTPPEHRVFLFDERLEDAHLGVPVDGFLQKFSGTVVLPEQRLNIALELGVF